MSRGKPFEPGNSFGRGRPKGSRNKSTAAALALLGEHAERLMQKCIAEALKGNMVAMRLCIERILPALREASIKFKAGPTSTCAEVGRVQDTILREVSKGRIVPQQGATVVNMLDAKRRVIEAAELRSLEERLLAAESSMHEDSEPDSGRLFCLEDAA
jgi:hypothetical protein